MKKYLVIDTHADEYSAREATYTMTVSQLISKLSEYDPDMPILAGNNRQSRNDWYTFSVIDSDRICEYEEEDEESEDYE